MSHNIISASELHRIFKISVTSSISNMLHQEYIINITTNELSKIRYGPEKAIIRSILHESSHFMKTMRDNVKQEILKSELFMIHVYNELIMDYDKLDDYIQSAFDDIKYIPNSLISMIEKYGIVDHRDVNMFENNMLTNEDDISYIYNQIASNILIMTSIMNKYPSHDDITSSEVRLSDSNLLIVRHNESIGPTIFNKDMITLDSIKRVLFAFDMKLSGDIVGINNTNSNKQVQF